MARHAHQRQVLLFLAAIFLPCVVLVALSLRIVRQDRELAEKRLLEEQRRRTNEVRQELLAILERIKLQEVTAFATQTQQALYENPAVVLVARVEKNRLVLPWETNPAPKESRKLLGEPAFALRIHQGEAAELFEKEPGRAADLYQQALEAARDPIQRAYAQLLLGRALFKSGRAEQAAEHYREVLKLPSDVVDEHDVPFAFYAAGRLLELRAEQLTVLERIRAEAETKRWLPPARTYMLRELAERLLENASGASQRETAQSALAKIGEHLRRLEQALALQNDFPKLSLMQDGANRGRSREPVWVPYGAETWLASLAPSLAGLPAAIVAVRADEVFATLSALGSLSAGQPGPIRFFVGEEAKGEALGPNFPGLKVMFAARDETARARQWNLQRTFYLVMLILVLGVTLFGAYLLWRDVRRELRLAELRAQFVSSVSHELKTPLTAIRMFAETLRMGRSSDPQTHAEYLETIVNESERLTRLLNNVLDFSKIEQGQKIYRPELTSLPEVVEAAARAMRYPLSQQGFELRVKVEDGLPPVRVDPDALEQAILNLLTNAMKYSGTGREIDLSLRTEDRHAVVEVTDHGVGIPPAEQARIFEKFYRAPTPENQLIPGTGLGLTLVDHIVRAHGGRIEVHSAPGKGSTFAIHLPLPGEV